MSLLRTVLKTPWRAPSNVKIVKSSVPHQAPTFPEFKKDPWTQTFNEQLFNTVFWNSISTFKILVFRSLQNSNYMFTNDGDVFWSDYNSWPKKTCFLVVGHLQQPPSVSRTRLHPEIHRSDLVPSPPSRQSWLAERSAAEPATLKHVNTWNTVCLTLFRKMNNIHFSICTNARTDRSHRGYGSRCCVAICQIIISYV